MPLSQEDRVKAFKAAFKLSAERKNSKIRWGPASKFWQSQSELAAVATALGELQKGPTPERMQAVREAIEGVSTKRTTKYQEALNALKTELDATAVESEQAVEGPPAIYKVKTGNGKYGFRLEDDTVVAENLTESRAQYIHNVTAALAKFSTTSGVKIDGMKKLVESIVTDEKLGKDSGVVEGTVWEEAIKHLSDKVLPTIAEDLGKLQSTGLIPAGANLKGVEFTGSDFHKGGKQVLLLRFEERGTEKKIVYKPSSLKVDSLLFGKDGVAAKLGGISTYNIVAVESDDEEPKDLGYGYMEFIETGGNPSSSEDVLGIYESLAASMAMSYYVGLEDVHEENIIVKKNGLQVIDMEATTGVFSENASVHLGGFYDQLWQKAINGGIGKQLKKLALNKELTELPEDSEVSRVMEAKFREVVANVGKESNKDALKSLQAELAKQFTRTVPIATNTFQKDLIPMVKEEQYNTLTKWRTELTEALDKPMDDKNPLHLAKGTTSTPHSTIKNLLEAEGVYKALRRGDVPYYRRQLGSDKVFDEEDNEIAVPGYKKVGQSIQREMEGRRTNTPDNLIDVFKTQGIGQVLAQQEEVRKWIESAKVAA